MASLASIVSTQVNFTKAAKNSPTQALAPSKRNAPRLNATPQSTNVQLSADGRVKSSLAEVQSAAKTLAEPVKAASTEDIKKSVQALVDSLNKALKATRNSVDARQSQANSQPEEERATPIAAEAQHPLATDNADLKKLGIVQTPEGTLTLDTKALSQALTSNETETRNLVARVARRIERAAASELGESGNATNRANAENAPPRALEARQTEEQQLAEASQRITETQATQLSTTLAGGLAAYQRTFAG